MHERPEERIRSPEAGVTGSCMLPNVGANKQTWVFHKGIKCS